MSSLTNRKVATGIGVVAASLSLGVAASAAPATAAHQKVSTVKISLGRVLSNPSGRVLYLFEKDTHNKSNCGKPCRAYWPLVKSTGNPTAGADVSASHLGRLATGQVTYYGHPLYYFVGDTKAKQDRGEGLPQFGAEWYAVSPSGKAVHEMGDDDD
jgi:predicted lipoprotein with Yx(FWY)xxD motif